MSIEYKICKRCVMDSSDPAIVFDENGYCNYCNEALRQKETTYFPNELGEQKLKEMIEKIKEQSKDKKYDCLMGISGGLDSSYLAYLGHKWGLRILAVHIDDGFDTQISKDNIKKLLSACRFDLEIVKPDAEQFNDLTVSYFKANVPDVAIPQDNVLFAYLYKYAKEYNIGFFLSGGNFALESILQTGNSWNAYDLVNLKDIHFKFGTKGIDKLLFMSDYTKFKNKFLLNIKTYRPLNYIDYNRDRALKELNEFCGFEYYGSKHLENDLTKFIQQYWFYERYNVDKRKSHLSSMIISNQMSREEALLELSKPLYDKDDMQKTKNEILKKLGITNEEFDSILKEKPKQHYDYATDWFIVYTRKFFSRLLKLLK
ncbi:N-acetyl sugar amidotransferase [Campylobacter gastrosuis]|uniref:N-acetyl sugar amidotransferase n=1 Tax=Campylobacter gastrosuis TaxID=2974576 RepID=A0ABT7HN07_9BACT|nr:N-acetyl sugar amidotransferase [Campylobacter gastrosuis]MDL0088301.1 N-acetyl sugar amidotransferase [Campylobacter gastrosuis]